MDQVRILIVDDELGALSTMVDLLEDMGYHPETAATGRQALEKIERDFFNVALLDIRLPDMDGTEVLARLRQRHPATCCIITTAYASKDTSILAMNEGAFAYIEKPLDMVRVSQTIEAALDKQRLERQNRLLLDRLQAVEDITDSALSTLALDDLLKTLLERAVRYLKANAAAIILVDEAGRPVGVRSSWGLGEEAESEPATALDMSFARRVLEEGCAVVISDADREMTLSSPYVRERGIKSLLGVPMRARDRVIGVAHVDTVSPRDFSPEDLGLFGKFADRAAILIDNARLYEGQRLLAEQARRSAEEAHTLYEISQNLVASMEVQERLGAIAGHVCRLTGATRCMVGLLEGEDLLVEFVPGGADAEEAERVTGTEFAPPLLRALRRSEHRVVDCTVDPLTTTDFCRHHRLCGVLLLPLVHSGRIIGVLGLDEPDRVRDFTPDQRRLGLAIAAQAAAAIENARAYERERTIARTLQESFLPVEPPKIPGFTLDKRYEPAGSAAQVGGDYFDFLELGEGRFGLVMGDVCGKGVTAAVYTAMAKYELRAYAAIDPSPRRVMTLLNAALYHQMSEECAFITLVYGVLDTHTGAFTYVNAAHPPPLLYDPRADRFEEMMPTGGMVGALPSMEYEERDLALPPGSILTLYTDGVTEARQGGDLLEVAGVRQVIQATSTRNATGIVSAIYHAALRRSGGALSDDVAIVVLRREECQDG